MPDLKPEWRDALIRFKERHGRNWKADLKTLWWTGRDATQEDGHLLRQIRNHIGPSKLDKLKL